MIDAEYLAKEFEKRTGITFKKKELLVEALTHRSYLCEVCYQRMEFLGDSLLAYFTSDYLFKKYKLFNEGELSKIKTEIVNKDNLSYVFMKLNLDDLVILDRKSFKESIPVSIKEDVIEALVAAVYLDSGIKNAKKIFKIILKNSKSVSEEFFAKNVLQEYSLDKFKLLPVFCTESTGSDNFICKIYINEKYYAESVGRSKKECEKKAALYALKQLQKEYV